MDFEGHCFQLSFTAETGVEYDEPEAYILKYKVLVHSESLTDGATQELGYFDVWRYNVDAYKDKDGHELFDMFDADSDESVDVFTAIFEHKSNDFKPNMVDFALGSDVLHFQWGHFPKDIQSSNLTLATVERIIDCIGGGCAAVALWPWDKPVPSLRKADSSEVIEFFQSQEEHEKHWGKIGFNRIKGTSILFRDRSFRGFSIEDILAGKYRRLRYDEE